MPCFATLVFLGGILGTQAQHPQYVKRPQLFSGLQSFVLKRVCTHIGSYLFSEEAQFLANLAIKAARLSVPFQLQPMIPEGNMFYSVCVCNA